MAGRDAELMAASHIQESVPQSMLLCVLRSGFLQKLAQGVMAPDYSLLQVCGACA